MNSEDDENTRNALSTLGMGPAAKELYLDLLRPAAAETGKNLVVVAKLLSHALTPVSAVVWGLDRVRDWLKVALLRRLSKVAPEDIQSPAAHIAGPILLQLPFCAEQEQLREMYANLLAAAMNKQSAVNVHPAFAHVVQQLTPDEAVVLQYITLQGSRLELHEVMDEDGSPRKGTALIPEQFRQLCERAGIESVSMSDTYLDNLLRLKLFIELHWSESDFHAAGHNLRGEFGASVETLGSRLLQLSAFGENFLRTCVVSIPANPRVGV